MGGDRASESAITGVHHRGERRPRALYGDDLAPGAIVGGYRIERLAARGGFAAVYRARHLTLARTVAIKVLHRELAATSDMLRRFTGEAHAVNRIAHPSIVDIHDVGTLRDGRPYLVMEWLDGRPLEAELAARGPLTALEALAVMEDLLPALAAAHDAGVIHRDVTAGNVLVVPRGHWFAVKLVDFGIAKLIAGDEPAGHSTSSEVRLGTPSHMAPEQIRGDEVDARTDLYGAGVLLFQLLTGRLPFVAGSSLELADLHLEAIAPRVSSCVPIAAAVDDVVARCLAKAPAERWPDARALLTALRAAIVGDPVAPLTGGCADATGVHVESHVADPDRAGAVAFEMIDEQLTRSTAAFEAAGLIVADRGPTDVLAIGFEPSRALAIARQLAATLPRRDGVDLAITVHVGPVTLRGRELVGGALLAAGTWKADAPSPGVQLTPAARRRLSLA